MLNRRLFVTALAAAGIAVASPAIASGAKLPVTASFDAVAEFARAVGGERISVTTMIPEGTEPHEYQPKPREIALLSQSKLLIINGFGLEPWAEKALCASGSKSAVLVTAGESVTPLRLAEGTDPHVWLSLSGAESEARVIESALSKIDPEGTAVYKKNTDLFVSRLRKLRETYEPRIKAGRHKSIVTGHAAFGYLARDLGLSQKSVENVYAEGAPTPRQLAALTDFCKKNGIHTVFAEELASPGVSKTLAREAGAKVIAIYTMESAENGLSYLERMESNLKAIAEAVR